MGYLLPAGIRFNDYLFTDPVSFSSWRPSGCGGIVAILGRNPQWAPKALQPLYFGEFGNNAGSGAVVPRLPEGARERSAGGGTADAVLHRGPTALGLPGIDRRV